MVVAKSNRRKRQDRVKAGAKRAEQARRRAKAEREQQTAERYRLLLDPRTSPADVAGILAAELPDSLAAGAMMQIRLSSGVPGEEIAQTARLMLASATGPPPIGTLAVAAWAAHVTGDEDAERGYASELLSRADAADDPELRLEVIRTASVRGHPGEACELIEPYLRERPDDELAAGIYAEALAKAHTEAEPSERERAALTRYGDRSGSMALRNAIDAFLGRTEWGATVRKWADAERSRLEAKYWQAAERDQFDALAAEEEGGQDGQLVWWGDQVAGPSGEPIVMHFHQDGSAHLLDPAEDAERLVLGRVTPDRNRVRVQVNSQRRLARLLQILAVIGAEPEVAEQARSEPSLDFAWGPVPDGASPAREWEKAWLEQSVAVLDFRSPRHSAAGAAEGSTAEALRLESLLRQLEYQAGLAAARGERPIDTEWLRTELGLTAPLSERAWTLTC